MASDADGSGRPWKAEPRGQFFERKKRPEPEPGPRSAGFGIVYLAADHTNTPTGPSEKIPEPDQPPLNEDITKALGPDLDS